MLIVTERLISSFIQLATILMQALQKRPELIKVLKADAADVVLFLDLL